MDGYQLLGNAVVMKAADDYRQALQDLEWNPNCTSAQRMKNDCERFFKSQWFNVFTSIDGRWLMNKLKMEAGYCDC